MPLQAAGEFQFEQDRPNRLRGHVRRADQFVDRNRRRPQKADDPLRPRKWLGIG